MRDYKYVGVFSPAIIFSITALITKEYVFGLWIIISIYTILSIVSIFKDALVATGEEVKK